MFWPPVIYNLKVKIQHDRQGSHPTSTQGRSGRAIAYFPSRLLWLCSWSVAAWYLFQRLLPILEWPWDLNLIPRIEQWWPAVILRGGPQQYCLSTCTGSPQWFCRAVVLQYCLAVRTYHRLDAWITQVTTPYTRQIASTSSVSLSWLALLLGGCSGSDLPVNFRSGPVSVSDPMSITQWDAFSECSEAYTKHPMLRAYTQRGTLMPFSTFPSLLIAT